MPVTRFERLVPWTGALAGLCWIGHGSLQSVSDGDEPSSTSTAVIESHLLRNHASVACLVVMGICLLFFATAVRNLLRSAEPSEATWSSVAYAGWIVVTASLSQLVAWNWALLNGAAGSTDDEAVRILGYGHFFGWAGLGIGLATALVAMGLGGLRGAVLPRWFAVTSVVFGVLGALGNAGIPPGGLVTYLLLPFWLLAAAVIIARQQRGPAGRVADDTPELSGATG
ncbi:MAG: hypothetical protein LKG20_04700 [Tetrasphaera jenkinsii]|jgi:type IV secretory pathway VirB2 component (pilin)|uniref:DUF4386 family protein n=1 Tax=Nostocoides jenkinsii Ben 74 TaxID=1193518 RepID=A0A077MCE2_9MICO|nr:hypothetical protein [Tetrasphaera jenkinsii]MCI1261570.1 hypothetical protein [Tetrasphaera jenkinsii]CCI53535.1 membrane hypothetical protein [Tetrasphaera jenkinsii Ben 74]